MYEMFKRQKEFDDRLINDFDNLQNECDSIFRSKFKEQPKINLSLGGPV